MYPINKILVPLDESELAERALEPAFALARETGAVVITLSVPVFEALTMVEPIGMSVVLNEDYPEHLEQRLVEYNQGICLRGERSGVVVRPLIEEGDVASVIVDTAVAEKVDLIVMSTHGRSGISRWMLGSVTEKVLRQAPCPVYVVRSPMPLERILIPLDGSMLSETALEPAFTLADLFHTDVTLMRVRVEEDIKQREVAELDQVEPGLGQRLLDGFYTREEDYLREITGRYEHLALAVDTAVRQGSPANAILAAADELACDLVVMSTHGRTGLQRWAYGSVTEKVLRGTECDMLIIRSV